jgi:hypothetical protein
MAFADLSRTASTESYRYENDEEEITFPVITLSTKIRTADGTRLLRSSAPVIRNLE